MKIELTADEMWVDKTRKTDKSKKIYFYFGEYWRNAISELVKIEGDDLHYKVTIEVEDA